MNVLVSQKLFGHIFKTIQVNQTNLEFISPGLRLEQWPSDLQISAPSVWKCLQQVFSLQTMALRNPMCSKSTLKSYQLFQHTFGIFLISQTTIELRTSDIHSLPCFLNTLEGQPTTSKLSWNSVHDISTAITAAVC